MAKRNQFGKRSVAVLGPGELIRQRNFYGMTDSPAYVHVRTYCSAASLKVCRILCPTSQNNTYTYICMCMYIHTYVRMHMYVHVYMLFCNNVICSIPLHTGGILVFSISSCYLCTYYLVPSTPLLCTLLDSIRTTDMDQLHTNIHIHV